MSEHRLDSYLNSIDDNDSTVTDDLLADILRWTPARSARNNRAVTEYAGVDSKTQQKPVQREIGAYEARGFFPSAEAEMRCEMDNRKLWFDAKMKEWKRVCEMCERGELR